MGDLGTDIPCCYKWLLELEVASLVVKIGLVVLMPNWLPMEKM
jgi:hypothetical protein